MKKIYGIIGTGKASQKAIAASLDDLEKDAVFYVPATRSEGMEMVYDWLIDNEREFIVIGNAGKTLKQFATEVHEPKMDDPNISVLWYLQDTDATVLVLWEDGLNEVIIKAHNEGHRILELTNGLAPITVEDEDAPTPSTSEEAERPTAGEEEQPSFLFREELDKMPIAAVKRYAVGQGIDIKGKSKEEIIDELFGPAVVEAPAPIRTEEVASIVVVFQNGTSMTIGADSGTMKRLFAAIS